MASFTVDQAEGLRKLLDKRGRTNVISLFSVVSDTLRDSALLNIGSSLARLGKKVFVFDTSLSAGNLPKLVCSEQIPSLSEVLNRNQNIYDAVKLVPQGFAFSYLYKVVPTTLSKDSLNTAFEKIAQQADITFVKAELETDDVYPLKAMASSIVVLQVSPGKTSIQNAYLMLKRLSAKLIGDSFGVLISDSSELEAENMFKNLQLTARRYLALDIFYVGFIQKDEHILRSMQPGHSLVKDFPRALSTQSFMRIAHKLDADYVSSGLASHPVSAGV